MRRSHAEEIRDYYRLCERAQAVGVPTSLDDPASPRTVAELEEATTSRERELDRRQS